MKKKQSLRKVRKMKNTFCKLRTVRELAQLLKIESFKLHLYAHQPAYRIFSIPKKDGSKRWIEDPAPKLKKVQRLLNHYLQATYFLCRSDATYGFMMSIKSDPEPRNIVTNAQKHLGANYLLNVDLEDFFHHIKAPRVLEVFQNKPFEFEFDLASLLTRLTCHQGRLPMGAPTSPVLSNFACRDMDVALLELSNWADWQFSRYADDLSFSSLDRAITEMEFKKIETIVQSAGFRFNPEKIKFYGIEEDKKVTGLLLREKVEIPIAFWMELDKDLLRLRHLREVQQMAGRSTTKWVDRFAEKVQGKVTFAGFVYGEEDSRSLTLYDQFENALHPPQTFETLSWLDFPYL